MKTDIKKGRPSAKKEKKPSVKIIPLGGLEQIGMNITAIEYEDTIVVIDCGLAFPEEDMLGIDLVIPDVSYLKDNIDKVKQLKPEKCIECGLCSFSCPSKIEVREFVRVAKEKVNNK